MTAIKENPKIIKPEITLLPDEGYILDFLPLPVQKVLEKSEYKFSQSEQVLLTLFAQIIIEIILKEEL
ncbi:hypothetical protein [Pedobacter gandavensis]|uniref:hypothetical protein n=1 Tax=Pedobacter gandavensis TaxID=2679963 RepID=UPI00292EA06C|nr:hypothetical protein [Pedobacter gandavensis]